MYILAIDPGNIDSALVLIEKSNVEILVLQKMKVENEIIINELTLMAKDLKPNVLTVEKIASYGMAVGATVFDTAEWSGRFIQRYIDTCEGFVYQIKRHEVKMNLCNSMKAKDSNIVQALIDRFAYDRHKETNKGKGTKKDPGFFYGFTKDIWQAFAVGVTCCDLYIKNT
jgi:hypothetical protein